MNNHEPPPEDFEMCEGHNCQAHVIVGECDYYGLCKQCSGITCPVCKGSGLGYTSALQVISNQECWRCLGLGKWVKP